MQRYILGRVAQAIASILVVSLIVFLLVRLTGNPLDVMLPEGASEEDYAATAKYLGLDKPLYVQYGLFLANAVRGDFGNSLRSRSPALAMVLERAPATLQLGAVAIIFSIIMALPIGVYAAVRRGKLLDWFGRTVAILGQSAPNFWVGIVLIFVFAVLLGVLPYGGRGGIENLILPAFAMGWYTVAGIMRLTRSSMLDVLDSDYILLARIKGLPERTVIWKHAFKNALLPVLTFSVILLVGMLHGSVVIETVFAWPGVGRLVIDAVRWRDFPVVQTVVLLLSVLYITANLMVDILYAYINPRIRYGK